MMFILEITMREIRNKRMIANIDFVYLEEKAQDSVNDVLINAICEAYGVENRLDITVEQYLEVVAIADKIPEIFSSAFDDFIERYEMEHGDAVVEYEAKIMNKV